MITFLPYPHLLVHTWVWIASVTGLLGLGLWLFGFWLERKAGRRGIPVTLGALQAAYPGFLVQEGEIEVGPGNRIVRVNSNGLRVPVLTGPKTFWHLDEHTGEFYAVSTRVGREYLYTLDPHERRAVEWLRIKSRQRLGLYAGPVWLALASAGFFFYAGALAFVWWALNVAALTAYLASTSWRTERVVVGPEPLARAQRKEPFGQQPHLVTASSQPSEEGRLS